MRNLGFRGRIQESPALSCNLGRFQSRVYYFAMSAHGVMCEQRIARGAKIPHLGAMEYKLSAGVGRDALQGKYEVLSGADRF